MLDDSLRFDFVKIKALTKGIDVKESLMEVVQNEEKILDKFWYSPVSINLNGELLTSAMLNTLKIQVGFTEDNEIGFIISKDDSIVHQSREGLVNLSNKHPLSYYLEYAYGYNFMGEKVDLDAILNTEILIIVQENSHLFDNIEVVNGET